MLHRLIQYRSSIDFGEFDTESFVQHLCKSIDQRREAVFWLRCTGYLTYQGQDMLLYESETETLAKQQKGKSLTDGTKSCSAAPRSRCRRISSGIALRASK